MTGEKRRGRPPRPQEGRVSWRDPSGRLRYRYGEATTGPIRNPRNRPRCPGCFCPDLQVEGDVAWCDCTSCVCTYGNRVI